MNNFKKIEHLFNSELSSYPLIHSIPWAYSRPEKVMSEWSLKTKTYFTLEESNLSHLQNLMNQNVLSGISKSKIQQYLKDKHAHLKQMKKMLSDFDYDKIDTPIIDNQSILSYQTNIFRDWIWGTEENTKYAEYILKHLNPEAKNILVLGAGSCGLSYMLAKKTNANIIATDINPYLFLVANKILNKKHVKLYEFNENTNEDKNISIKREIKPVEQVDNHYQIFSDFFDSPFKEQSFDAIVGCWFYDIIESPLQDSLLHSNELLKDDGQSFFVGPSSIHKSKTELKLTTQEIIETYKNNFTVVDSEADDVCYLNNPLSTYKRIENILFLNAKKPTKRKKLDQTTSQDDFIQLTPSLVAYKQKTEVFHKILKHIERPMTLTALAREVQKEFGFSEEEAKYYTENFIKKLNFELGY